MCYLSWDQWRADVDAGARESLSTEGPVVVVHVSVQLSSGLAFNVLLLGSCVLLSLPLLLMLLLLLPAILLLSSGLPCPRTEWLDGGVQWRSVEMEGDGWS